MNDPKSIALLPSYHYLSTMLRALTIHLRMPKLLFFAHSSEEEKTFIQEDLKAPKLEKVATNQRVKTNGSGEYAINPR